MDEKEKYIDLGAVLRKIINHRKVFYKTLPIVFVMSCFIIICVPRSYTTSSMLAPEIGASLTTSSLGSLASSFGLDITNGDYSDAISPLLYPDLMKDNGFVVRLFPIRVRSVDGEIDCTYYEYIKEHQKMAWWSAIPRFFKSLIPKQKDALAGADAKKDPYVLSRDEDRIVSFIQNEITLSVDNKTGVITIETEAQDPMICKILADSVTVHLQKFITEYRTNKARIDLEYYKHLVAEAKHNYEEARREYGKHSDENTSLILETYRLDIEGLQNEMQLKFDTYTQLNTQLQAAIAKVQERTPAFTTLKGANVPVKASKPKRMIFVLAMLFLCTAADVVYIFKDEIIK